MSMGIVMKNITLASITTSSKEKEWDKLLKIRTSGRDDSNSNQYNYPYEPTPYIVLERLANSDLIGKKDVILDYGCGKGRVDFFLNYQTRAKTIGIEYDKRIYQSLLENQKTAVTEKSVYSDKNALFLLERAENYKVPKEVTCCYFFNPFSVELLQKVIARVLESYYRAPRRIQLFFYYPSEEYISYLMTVNELQFEDEIDCSDIGDGEKQRERIVVFVIDIM